MCYSIKSRVLLLLFLGAFASASAQSGFVIRTSQQSSQIPFAGLNELKFSDDYLIVNYSSGESSSIDLKDLKCIYFNGMENGISTTNVSSYSAVLIYANERRINIPVKSSNSIVRIFNAQGSIIGEYRAAQEISISNLAKGMYIISTDKGSMKVIQ